MGSEPSSPSQPLQGAAAGSGCTMKLHLLCWALLLLATAPSPGPWLAAGMPHPALLPPVSVCLLQ